MMPAGEIEGIRRYAARARFRVGRARRFRSHGNHPGFQNKSVGKRGSGATFRQGGSPVASRVMRRLTATGSNGAVCTAARHEALFPLAPSTAIARVRERPGPCSPDPTQWWREAIGAAFRRSCRNHIVVEPLAAVICGICVGRAVFDRLIGAARLDPP
jgi:hypothetical protein